MLRASATTSTSARYACSARPSIACRALPQARLANTTPPCSDQQQQQYAPASWTRRMLSAAAAATCAAMLAMPQPVLALPPGKADVTPQQLVEIIKEDFLKRKYLVTGDVTLDVYADDCYFEDPNNKFDGLGTVNWSKGVKFLFIGERCKLALTGPVTLDEQARTITFEGWRQVDVFRVPGAPHTKVFTGRTVLKLDPVDNLVVSHIEYWDASPNELFTSFKFFDPDFNPPGFDA